MDNQPTQIQPQPNRVVQPEQPDTKADPPDVVVIDMAGKKNRRIFVIVIILLAFGFLPGWLLLWQSDQQAQKEAAGNANVTTESNSPVGMSCDQRLKRYENNFMDIGFCYPASWGEALVQEGKFEPTDTGSRWRLTFSTKEQVTVGLVSPDWSTTVPRAPTCLDPATQTVPAFTPVNTAWKTDGTPVVSGGRGIEAKEGKYRIEEYVADLSTNGVCLTGYVQLGGLFRHAVATYSAEFSPVIVSPAHHIANPNNLIASTDRAAFAAFVKSMRKL